MGHDAFIGRTAELELLGRLLGGGQARLVTLLGPAGAGKSALARAYSARAAEPVVSCALGDSASVGDALRSVLGALGASHVEGDPEDALPPMISVRGTRLLLLDGVSHLAPALAPVLDRLLGAAPTVSLLVTSEQALGLRDEHLVVVPPLSLPAAGDLLEVSEAGRLLVHHVGRVRGTTGLEPGETAAARDILRLLDGLPLAIELCAAQMDLLDAGAMLARLDGAPVATSLERAIGASFERLDPVEKAAAAQCAVFAGGFRAEAAAAVVMLPPGETRDVATVLAALRRKSWLFTGPGRRSSMMGPLAQHAAAHAPPGLLDAARRRHLRHHAALGRELVRRYEELGDVEALRALCAIVPELVAAGRHAAADGVTADDAREGLWALAMLRPVLDVRVLPGETLSLVERLVEREGREGAPDVALAHALYLRGAIGNAEGRDGLPDLRRAIDLAEAAGAGVLVVLAQRLAMTLLVRRGALDEAEEVAARTAAAGRERPPIANAGPDQLAILHLMRGRPDEAIAAGQEAAEGRARYTSPFERAAALGRLALVYLHTGRTADAGACIEGVREAAAALDSPLLRAHALALAGDVSLDAGELDDASERLDEAATALRLCGLRRSEARIAGSGAVARAVRLAPGDADDAARTLAQVVETLEGEKLFGGLFAAYRGLLHGRSGALAEAQRWLRRAAGELEGGPIAPVAEILEVAASLAGSPASDPGVPALLTRAKEIAARADEGGIRSLRASSYHVRVALRVLSRAVAERAAPPAASERRRRLELARDGSWFRIDAGPTVPIGARSPLRRLLVVLAEQRCAHGGEPARIERLLETVWPGQSFVRDSGEARLRMSISRLRRLGLADLIETTEGGYRLTADVEHRDG